MKKGLIVLLLMVIFVAMAGITYASDIKVSINGQVQIFDVPPVSIEGRTRVPLRHIFEALGADLDWEASTQTITGSKDGKQIVLVVGQKFAMIDGERNDLDVPAMLINGRTMVPTRFIAESLGADVGWDGASRTVLITNYGNQNGYSDRPIINEKIELVSKVEFNDVLLHSNDSRQEMINAGFDKDLTNYRHSFGHTLSYFTDEEVSSLFKQKPRKSEIKKTEALEDVDVLFKFLEAYYGAYEYFGGNTAFNAARKEIIDYINETEIIYYNQLVPVIYNSLSFIQDAHFRVHNAPVVVQYKYYYNYDHIFSKDKNGFYKNYNAKKYYVQEIPSPFVSIQPTLHKSGEIYYSPVYSGPEDALVNAGSIVLSDGSEKIEERITWTKSTDLLNEGGKIGSSLIDDLNGSKYIPFRPNYFNESNLNAYQAAGSRLKGEKIVIIDARGNYGRGDRYQQAWFRGFTGKNFNLPRVEAIKTSNLSLKAFQNFGNRMLNDGSFRGSWRMNISNGEWFSNNSKIIVLIDNRVGSSGESMIFMMRTLENAIFVGSNTMGCTVCGMVTNIYLPNSGIPITCGNTLRFTEKRVNIDGIGIQPDIWADPNTSLEAVLAMVEKYDIK